MTWCLKDDEMEEFSQHGRRDWGSFCSKHSSKVMHKFDLLSGTRQSLKPPPASLQRRLSSSQLSKFFRLPLCAVLSKHIFDVGVQILPGWSTLTIAFGLLQYCHSLSPSLVVPRLQNLILSKHPFGTPFRPALGRRPKVWWAFFNGGADGRSRWSWCHCVGKCCCRSRTELEA